MTKMDLATRERTTRSTMGLVREQQASLMVDLNYDYSRLDEDQRELLQHATIDIRARLRKSVEDMIAIGKHLIFAKVILAHGEFEKWLRVEFGMSETLALEYRHVAERFDGKSTLNVLLTPTTARMLAAPSVKDEVIQAVAEATVAQGRPLQLSEVKAIKRELAPPKPKQLPAPAAQEIVAVRLRGVAHYVVAPQQPEMDEELAAMRDVAQERAEEEAERLIIGDEKIVTMPIESKRLVEAGFSLQQIGDPSGSGGQQYRYAWEHGAIVSYSEWYPHRADVFDAAFAALAVKAAAEAFQGIPQEPEAPSSLSSFAEWLAAMPNDLALRDHLAILELAKGSATRLRNVRPSLYNAVSNAIPTWSLLIIAVEKEMKDE